jgi:hypothetical protein
LVEAHRDVTSNIFSNNPSGPELVHEPIHFRPEVAVIARAFSLPGQAKGLTRESAGNKVDCSDISARQLSNVFVNWNVRPMLRQHPAAKRIDLAKRRGLESARTFQAEAEAANAAEQVECSQHTSKLRRG